MLCFVIVLRRVLVLGRVAAAHMAARETDSEVNPIIACEETILAALGARLNGFNLIKVRAFFGHQTLL